MKRSLAPVLPLLILTTTVTAQIKAVPWTQVDINGGFWKPRQQALNTVTLRQQFDQLVEHKYKQNFERAAARRTGGYVGYVFNDSDVYKVLEAASYALGKNRQPWLEQEVDNWIALIGKAQEPDGYLNCYFQLMSPNAKWTNLRDQHELYCAGHLFEAAAAHYQATGKTTLLNIATKLADHIANRFGEGKRMGYPGHPEAELALFKLWRVTGNQSYFELSKFFIEKRGSKFFAKEHNTPLDKYDGDYWSDNVPMREHSSIVGHAVRAAYLFSGVTDLAIETKDQGLTQMLDRVWKSTALKRMFITGGIGPSGSNEGFTVDYDLPTFTAYQESCASIANALWNYRLALLHKDSKFADVLEQAVYNGALAGINLKGDQYYYVNPLASEGGHHRQDWFGCACCPPNLARLIGQIGGLSYGTDDRTLYTLLYTDSRVKTNIGNDQVTGKMSTNWPWDGKVSFTVENAGSGKFSLAFRQPGWSEIQSLSVNGSPVKAATKSGFLYISRTWKKGDVVQFNVPMQVRKVVSHPSVKDTAGMFALKRGPLVYCVEQADNAVNFDQIGVPFTSDFVAESDPTVFGGTTVLRGSGFVADEARWLGRLFQALPTPKPVALKAIPYFMWDNRKPGAMRVWLSPNPAPAPLRGYERTAKVSVSFKNYNSQPEGVNDGFTPATSNPNSPKQLHFWSHLGGNEWVQYDFAKPVNVSSMRVFWFDDSGRGACRIPEKWRVEALVSGRWVSLELTKSSSYTTKLDVWNEVHFAPIKASALRLHVDQKEGFSSGIHEWQVFGDE